MEIRFLAPGMAAWLALVPAIALLGYLHQRARLSFRRAAGFGAALAGVSRLSPGRREWAVLAAAVLAAAALVLAVMRPQLLREIRVPAYARQDLVLILDRSVSMQARDIAPSRFARAISEIRTFLEHKPDEIDRVGLVGFAGTSIVLSYLTRDLGSLFFFLDYIRDDQEVYFGTDLAGAIEAARTMAARDPADTDKIFLLVSDGDDHSERLGELLDALQGEGVRVHTIGIGAEDTVPIPLPGLDAEGEVEYLVDGEGNRLTTRLDESTLRRVAAVTGGSFHRSTTGRELAGSLQQVVEREQRQVGWDRRVEYVDAHLPLLLVSAVSTFFLLLRA